MPRPPKKGIQIYAEGVACTLSGILLSVCVKNEYLTECVCVEVICFTVVVAVNVICIYVQGFWLILCFW